MKRREADGVGIGRGATLLQEKSNELLRVKSFRESTCEMDDPPTDFICRINIGVALKQKMKQKKTQWSGVPKEEKGFLQP